MEEVFEKKVNVRFGPSITKDYILYETTAPKAYDEVGTLTYYESKEKRLVLIEVCTLNWQLSRYASGTYSYNHEDILDPDEIAIRMFEKMVAGFGEGEKS